MSVVKRKQIPDGVDVAIQMNYTSIKMFTTTLTQPIWLNTVLKNSKKKKRRREKRKEQDIKERILINHNGKRKITQKSSRRRVKVPRSRIWRLK